METTKNKAYESKTGTLYIRSIRAGEIRYSIDSNLSHLTEFDFYYLFGQLTISHMATDLYTIETEDPIAYIAKEFLS